MKHLPGHGSYFESWQLFLNHDIIVFHIERGQTYKEFTLKAECKTTRDLQNLQKVTQERV